MKKIFFITMPIGADKRPLPVSEDVWEKICAGVEAIISSDHAPIPIIGKDHTGKPLVMSNVICFSPADKNHGGNFVFKRVGSKLLTRVISYSEQYDSVIAAVLLVLKGLISDVNVTCSAGEIGFERGIRYYEYITQVNAPVVYQSQARRVIIEFSWSDNANPQQCEQILEQLRETLSHNRQNILNWNIKFE